MGSQVVAISKQQVTGRTALHTDIVFLNLLNQMRVLNQAETMSNSLRTKSDCIKKLSVESLSALTCVEVELEVFTPSSFEFSLVL